MTSLFLFYLVGLKFLCHLPVGVSSIEYWQRIRSILREYQVFVIDTQKQCVTVGIFDTKKGAFSTLYD